MGTKALAAVLALSAALAVAGCGDDEEANAPAAPSSGETSASDGGGIVSEAKANVEKAMAPPSTDLGLKPFSPPAGKTIGEVSILQAAPGPAAISKGIKEAASELGWKSSVLDGKQSPKGYADADRLFTQQKVDGIVHTVVADSASPTSLAAAVDAGIKVVCVYCANDLDKPVDKPSISSVDPDFKGQGAMLADWIIADSNGQAKVAVQNNDAVPAVRARYEGFIERMKACTTCEIVDDQKVSPGADVVGNGRRTTTALLQKFPKGKLGYMVTASDGEAVGPGQIMKSTGRSDVKLASYDCDELNLEWVRTGGPEHACVASPLTWGGWAAIDDLARAFAGEEPSGFKVPSQLITKENAPAGKARPFADTDFRGAFKQLWSK